jgi:hypothetical protein
MFFLASFADSDVDYLPFIKLRNTTNVVKKDLPPADDTTSTDIDVPLGFAFGNISPTTVYVWLETHFCCMLNNIPIISGCN